MARELDGRQAKGSTSSDSETGRRPPREHDDVRSRMHERKPEMGPGGRQRHDMSDEQGPARADERSDDEAKASRQRVQRDPKEGRLPSSLQPTSSDAGAEGSGADRSIGMERAALLDSAKG